MLISPQQGHTYPLMFSTSPSTGSAVARVNERHFIASSSATACGVVTITAEMRACTGAMCSMSERCSSDVPANGEVGHRGSAARNMIAECRELKTT